MTEGERARMRAILGALCKREGGTIEISEDELVAAMEGNATVFIDPETRRGEIRWWEPAEKAECEAYCAEKSARVRLANTSKGSA